MNILHVTNPLQLDIDLGPIVNRAQYNSMLARIAKAEMEGARLVLDGRLAATAAIAAFVGTAVTASAAGSHQPVPACISKRKGLSVVSPTDKVLVAPGAGASARSFGHDGEENDKDFAFNRGIHRGNSHDIGRACR